MQKKSNKNIRASYHLLNTWKNERLESRRKEKKAENEKFNFESIVI
jgi:hypothetical protein